MTDQPTDDAAEAAETTDTAPEKPSLKANLRTGSTWLRGFFMLLFAVFYGIAEFLLFAVAIFQFLTALVTRRPNERLVAFGRTLSRYVYEVMLYLTYASERRPFPFETWPADPGPTDAATPPEPPGS